MFQGHFPQRSCWFLIQVGEGLVLTRLKCGDMKAAKYLCGVHAITVGAQPLQSHLFHVD